jgi:NADH:ubiquinone oxidoreductase subunit B-like Fe-S oxidoreductase
MALATATAFTPASTAIRVAHGHRGVCSMNAGSFVPKDALRDVKVDIAIQRHIVQECENDEECALETLGELRDRIQQATDAEALREKETELRELASAHSAEKRQREATLKVRIAWHARAPCRGLR